MESQPSERGSAGAASGRAESRAAGGRLVRGARALWRLCYGPRIARVRDAADGVGVPRVGRRVTPKARWFWPLALALLVADCASKRAVENRLTLGQPYPLVGETVRFTLSYNTNAAMGFQLGGDSRRLVLSSLTIAALVVLGVLYH